MGLNLVLIAQIFSLCKDLLCSNNGQNYLTALQFTPQTFVTLGPSTGLSQTFNFAQVNLLIYRSVVLKLPLLVESAA